MSNLVVSNISDGSTSVGTGFVLNGSAKAGANWDGVSFGVRDSTNVSSVTDNGTSDFTVNYSSAMSSADYMFAGIRGRQRLSGAQDGNLVVFDSSTAPTSSTTRVRSYNEAFSGEDFYRNCLMIFGDLA